MTYDKFGVLIGFANESGEFVNIGPEDPFYYNEVSIRGFGKNRFFKGAGARMLPATNFSADFAMVGEINKLTGGVDKNKQYKKKEQLTCSLNIDFLLSDTKLDVENVPGLSGLSGQGDPYPFMNDYISGGNATGYNYFPIYAGGQVFNKCYLQNVAIDIRPFRPVICKATFKSFQPPSGVRSDLKGLPIYQEEGSINSGTDSNAFVYGHTCELSGAWSDITNVDSISQITLNRTYGRKDVYCLGQIEPRESLVTNVENTLVIKATGLKKIIPNEGIKLLSGLHIILKNGNGTRLQTDPYANNVGYNLDEGVSLKSGCYVVGQSFSNKAGGTIESTITVKEAIL